MTSPDQVAAASAEEGYFERVALGSLIAYPQAIDTVTKWLRAEDFTWPAHRAIYESAVRLREDGAPVDRTSVLADLRRNQHPDPEQRINSYVLSLDDHVAVPMSAAYHCRTVLEHSVRRELETVGVRLEQLGERGIGSPDELLDQADAIVAKVQDVRQRWNAANPRARQGEPNPYRRPVDTRTVEVDGQLFGVSSGHDTHER